MNGPALYTILFAVFFMKSFLALDPDFGWHIASGEYIVTHGIPYKDIYSYTAPDFAWVHHEWLADVINYTVYQNFGGYTAVAILYGALWTLSVWLLARSNPYRLIVLLTVVVMLPFVGVRAVAWSVLLFAVLILASRQHFRRQLVYVPLLFLLWANIHGSFVVGLVYLVWIALFGEQRHRTIVILTLSLVATLLNPYGIGIYIEVIRTTTDSSLHSRIGEWRPFQLDIATAALVGIWGGLIGVRYQTFWQRVIRFENLLLVMSSLSARHVVLFGLAFLSSFGTIVRSIKIPDTVWRDGTVRAMSGAAVGALCITILYAATAEFQGYSWNREDPYPSQIASQLNIRPCSGSVFAHYDFGGYLIWKVPGQKLYIDGRMPSWELNGKKYMDDYLRIINDPVFQQQEFDQHSVRCVIWSKDHDFAKRLLKDGWRVTQSESTNSIVLLEK